MTAKGKWSLFMKGKVQLSIASKESIPNKAIKKSHIRRSGHNIKVDMYLRCLNFRGGHNIVPYFICPFMVSKYNVGINTHQGTHAQLGSIIHSLERTPFLSSFPHKY